MAPGFLVLTNTAGAPASGTITAVTDGGSSERTAVAVPAGGVVAPSIPVLSSGSWESEIVSVSGGGVAVTQAVHGSSGWAQAPCQSTTSATWYFAGGTTVNSDGLYVSLFNPTSTPVVVDLSFMTPAGAVHPINYQGIVLQPGQVQVENVASEVQNVSTVSTVVSTRTGRVVASEVQVFAGPSAGLALVPGAAYPESQWTIPQAQEVGGHSEIDVFNPGAGAEHVTVRLRLPSAPLAPLTATVAGGSTWALATSTQTRIPHGETYSAVIDATGGTGVVVSRTVTLPGERVGAPGRSGHGRRRPEHRVADRHVGGAPAGDEREPRGERRRRRLPGAGEHRHQRGALRRVRSRRPRATNRSPPAPSSRAPCRARCSRMRGSTP